MLRVRWHQSKKPIPQVPVQLVSGLPQGVVHVLGWQGGDERCLTNFNIYPLDVASCLGDVDLVLILRIGNSCEDLGGELDGAAFGVRRLGGLAGGLVQGGAMAC
jgi:hypothetical protein